MRLGNYAVLALVGVGLLAGFRASGRIRS